MGGRLGFDAHFVQIRASGALRKGCRLGLDGFFVQEPALACDVWPCSGGTSKRKRCGQAGARFDADSPGRRRHAAGGVGMTARIDDDERPSAGLDDNRMRQRQGSATGATDGGWSRRHVRTGTLGAWTFDCPLHARQYASSVCRSCTIVRNATRQSASPSPDSRQAEPGLSPRQVQGTRPRQAKDRTRLRPTLTRNSTIAHIHTRKGHHA